MDENGEKTVLQSTLGLVLGAFFMTVFELVFLFYIVFPEVRASLSSTIESNSVSNFNKIHERFASLGSVARALEERERYYRGKINNMAVASGWALTGVLLVCVIVLVRYMKHRGAGVITPIVMCVLTVAVLMTFQVYFYYNTRHDYKYISSNAEMLDVVLSDACDD